MIIVLSDLRRPKYLRATLAAADAAGAAGQERAVVADAAYGSAGHDLLGWPVVYATRPPGSWGSLNNRWATWAAFDLALARGEDLVFLEDDVLPCARALEYALTVPVPLDCAWLSLYAPWGDATMLPAIWRLPARKFTFCQAIVIPRRTLEVLASARPEMARSGAGGSDENMALIGHARGWLYGTHYPGLFQHVGRESSVTGPGAVERISRAWPGADFDAMSLRKFWPRAFE